MGRNLRQALWSLFEDIPSSPLSHGLLLYMTLVNFAGLIILCIGSMPNGPSMVVPELIVTIHFSVEFFVRWFVCPTRRTFLLSLTNLLDLATFLPYFAQLMIFRQLAEISKRGFVIIRLVRVVRFLRIFAFYRASRYVRRIIEALQRAWKDIFVLFITLSFSTFLFGALIFIAETSECVLTENNIWVYTKGKLAGTETLFQSIPHSLWWAVVTISTVGYGDIYPITGAGKLVASLAMLFGIVIVAFPITLLSTHYAYIYNREKQQDYTIMHNQAELLNEIMELKRLIESCITENVPPLPTEFSGIPTEFSSTQLGVSALSIVSHTPDSDFVQPT